MRILSSGGITFNGDTAAANALDDYEEGTWTVGVTYSANTGTYTKIGRQVTVNGWLILTNKGSSTGVAKITGLPFSVANTQPYYSAGSMRLSEVSYTGSAQAYGGINTTIIAIEQVTEAGTPSSLTNGNFANNSSVMITLTYFTA
jgi:hypothetical protein